MQHVFLDTNVFLDAMLQRTNDYLDCEAILTKSFLKEIRITTSSSILITVMFFLEKEKLARDAVINVTDNLLKLISLRSPSEETFRKSLHAGFPDLEDAVQYFTALQISDIDYFVTSNTKDFKKASAQLPVITASQFIKFLIKDNQAHR